MFECLALQDNKYFLDGQEQTTPMIEVSMACFRCTKSWIKSWRWDLSLKLWVTGSLLKNSLPEMTLIPPTGR